MPLLISDANILIDMDDGGLLEQMFQLNMDFAVPDILFEEELAPYYPNLLSLGLVVLEMPEESISNALSLRAQYGQMGVSANDCLALTLAKQESCPLLTGDKKLRDLCKIENIDHMGTLWLVEQMIRSGFIDCGQAKSAYEAMRDNGSWLPWKEIEKQLTSLEGI